MTIWLPNVDRWQLVTMKSGKLLSYNYFYLCLYCITKKTSHYVFLQSLLLTIIFVSWYIEFQSSFFLLSARCLQLSLSLACFYLRKGKNIVFINVTGSISSLMIKILVQYVLKMPHVLMHPFSNSFFICFICPSLNCIIISMLVWWKTHNVIMLKYCWAVMKLLWFPE